MTGHHPIHTGLQHNVLNGAEPWGVPLDLTMLPQHLRKLGYATHAIGKWHQGFFKKEYIPTERGFDSHFGYWTGHEDYYDRTSAGNWVGIDFRINEKPLNTEPYEGLYSTELYTNITVNTILNHTKSSEKPLFLYLAHQAVHAGNIKQALQAPQKYIDRFSYIKDERRRTFAGMVSALDDSIGDIFSALHKANILNESIIIFTTDNGGATGGTAGWSIDDSIGSNWPLRGAKYTLWEGGIRGVSFIWSSFLKNRYINDNLIHIQDWLPTIYSAVGGSVHDLGNIDGIDMWNILNNKLPEPRNHLLHNIDDIWKVWALRSGDYKLISGTVFGGDFDGWFLPPGENRLRQYSVSTMNYKSSKVYSILKQMNVNEISIKEISVNCSDSFKSECRPTISPCLFNIRLDPCEFNNIALQQPKLVESMLNLLSFYNSTAITPGNRPPDKRANPVLHNYRWDIWA